MQAVEKEYAKDAKEIQHIDGLGMDFGEWRFNLRASNTLVCSLSLALISASSCLLNLYSANSRQAQLNRRVVKYWAAF